MEQGHVSEADGEEHEELDTDGRGNAFPSDSDAQVHPPATSDLLGSG